MPDQAVGQTNVVPFATLKNRQQGKRQRDDAPPPMPGVEFGVERNMPFGNWGAEGEIVNANKVRIDELVEMRRRDGQARALMRLYTLPILAAMEGGEWIAPEDEEMEAEVEFANQMWSTPPSVGGMSTSKMTILKKTLQSLVDGFAVFEEVRHVPEEGPLAGKITLQKLAYRDPRTITFRADDHGGFNGIRQMSYRPDGTLIDVKIPKEKVWYYSFQEEENPFYGVSLFEAAYYHYEIKRKLYYIAHLAAQFAAVPGRVGNYPAGADPRRVAEFRTALANFAFNTSMTAPEGWEVTPFNGNSNFDFLKLIDHHNSMMSKSVVAAFIDQPDRAALVEVNGASDPSADFFMLGLEAIMDEIAYSWSTYLMPKYIDWNFGSKKYPVFRFGKIADAAKNTIKDLFTAVVTSSVLNSTPEFVREMEKKLADEMDLDIDYDEIEKQEKEAAEAEAKARQEELDQQTALQEQMVQDQQPIPGPPGAPAAPPPGGPPGAGPAKAPAPFKKPGAPVALSAVVDSENPGIDDLVSLAQELLIHGEPEGAPV